MLSTDHHLMDENTAQAIEPAAQSLRQQDLNLVYGFLHSYQGVLYVLGSAAKGRRWPFRTISGAVWHPFQTMLHSAVEPTCAEDTDISGYRCQCLQC